MTKFRGTVKWFDPTKGFGFITSVQKVEDESKCIKIHDVEQKDSDKDAVDKWMKNAEGEKDLVTKDIFCHHTSIIRESSFSEADSHQRNSFHSNENDQRNYVVKKLKQGDKVEFVICWSNKTVDNQKQPQAIDVIALTQEEISETE
ncbi:MAG: putative secreted protein [Candidatus Phytoplasma cynodontis]|uniref:cold-shock protein n=1 Tax='Cynodon dactylon' phytoplasma TaxID=295320 RepID=UPI001265BEF5|nr:cold shock domain-containing protein ['Cynodon dactylon' phytoplasma]KAB8121951.1 cold shock domain-containing protein ['Cynodon dactylon' phytoplasma]WIA07639.1 MAG: putative secreted protein [Candidatus Phytoplasma cynodontis]